MAAVLIDLTMPGMNGMEVVRALREADGNVPLLLMSGYTELDLETESAGLGLAGFVAKPFQPPELVNAVERAIKARG
jgi:CheY-like chemotaxis protein